MSEIICVDAQEILDSRGNPTVEAVVTLASGVQGRAAVPAGVSIGVHEALELRDGDKRRYRGQGVLQVVQSIKTEIHTLLIGKEVSNQSDLDALMLKLDGTPNKARLGANAVLAVSLALAKAASLDTHQAFYAYLGKLLRCDQYKLPVPFFNILNGGAHADNNLALQEFMVVPIGSVNFNEALRCGSEIFFTLRQLLKKRGLSTTVGDEGGFAPNLRSHIEAFDLILEAIEHASYTAGNQVYIAIDAASSGFYQSHHYRFENKLLTTEEWLICLCDWVKQYPIISIEDGMAENDFRGWTLLTQLLGEKIQLVGDDLFVTNPSLLSQGILNQWGNAILIKLNQIGSLTETIAAINMAKQAHYAAIISHRSGETEDTTIADLAVAAGVGQIKAGAPCRTDRTAKYNQLLRLEKALGEKAIYAAREAFAHLRSRELF